MANKSGKENKKRGDKIPAYFQPQKKSMSLRDVVHQLFDEVFFNDEEQTLDIDAVSRNLIFPRMDVVDTEKTVFVTADIPGLILESLDIRVDGPSLILSGHLEQGDMNGHGAYVMCERHSGPFGRTVSLPSEVTIRGASALYGEGVLRLTLPKKLNKKNTCLLYTSPSPRD